MKVCKTDKMPFGGVTLSLTQETQEELLKVAAGGDKDAREELIRTNMPFILRVASQSAHRFLHWGRDDELSIAMIAFNEAIDSYEEKLSGNFQVFARMVIKRRLIDYYRKAKSNGPAAELEGIHTLEDWEKDEREQEVVKYEQVLKTFDLDFNIVSKHSPKHAKTRVDLQKAARMLAEHDNLMKYLRSTGKLPQRELCRLAGITGRVLERGRVYVIALGLLLADDEFPYLKEAMSNFTGSNSSTSGARGDKICP